jgi:photosystem II stability/assembly factor-like uncharacterized protein
VAESVGVAAERRDYFAAKAIAARKVIAVPGGGAAWRIAPNGSVERTGDGVTWQMQPTGVGVTLTDGSAPSPTVCWLVGPGGTIVLSVDGRTWQRVAFPESIDLASIRATDDTHAVVTAADGRRFTTADGGRTWTR